MKKSLFLVVLAVLVAVFAVSCDGESAAAEPKKFTVKFDLNGGTSAAIDDQTVVEGEKAKEPAAPTLADHEFKGWKLGEEAFDFNTPITKDITLVASWGGVTPPGPEPETKYTVKFDLDGGTSAVISDQEIVKGEKATAPTPEPTREGYAFKGWYIVNETEEKEFEFDTPITGDIELKAKWVEVHTVAFDLNGGTADPEIGAQTVEHGSCASVPAAPTKTGYKFTGWYEDGAAEAFDFGTAITKNITLKAEWEINKYTVTFDVDDDTTTISAKSVEHGKTAEAPTPVPTKTGYTFKYWSLDGSKFNFNTPITKDITLKAEWEIYKYTVTFDVDGDTTKIPAKTVAYGKKAEAPTPVPTKTGYGFDGWYAGASATTAFDFENTPIEADITLSARWVKLFSVDATGVLSLTPEGKDYIDRDSFNNEEGIKIDIPESFDGKIVVTIGASAFKDRKNVREVTIPSKVKKIGNQAFSNSGIKSITIPSNVNEVETFAFSQCSNLAFVEIESLNAVYAKQVFMNCKALDEVIFPEEMTSKISDGMFQGCTELAHITNPLPVGIPEVGKAAFYQTKLSSVSLADTTGYYSDSFPSTCSVSGGNKLD